MNRFTRASLTAPLTAPLLYYSIAIVAAILDPVRRASAGLNLFSGLALVLAFGAPVAYAATFALGLPLLWLVRRVAPLTLARVILVGFLVGLGVAMGLAPWLRGELISIPLPPLQGGLLGSASAAVWYWLAFGPRIRSRS
jgi:apolipoprotein N-acyltransferase